MIAAGQLRKKLTRTATLLALAVACRRAAPATEPVPASSKTAPRTHTRSVARAPLPPANPKLPAVPDVDGPLKIRVVYPEPRYVIPTADSNFVFGSVGNGRAGLRVNGALVPVWPNGAFMGWVANPPTDAQWYDLLAYTASDTAQLRFPVRTRAALTPTTTSGVVETVPVSPSESAILHDDSLDRAASDTDNLIIGRPSPTGIYKWFLFAGTPIRVTGYRGDMARVELDDQQSIWVQRRDIRASTAALARAATSRFSASSASDGVTLQLALPRPPAYLVQEEDVDALSVTFYGVTIPVTTIETNDSLVRSARLAREDGRSVLHVRLARAIYGYLALYERGTFKLVLRRPPIVDPAAPLRGLTIVVDPGHPPIGATGPTGLWEPVATLAVGLKVRTLLEQEGAHVVMTRVASGPVALGDRPVIGRRADANAFVSIHLNANPDGQNPFRDNGTGTYYFHPHSKPLARFLDESLVPELGLHNRGVFFQNLAVCRPTWFPSALAEGLFIIMPDQEAAIRTPEYQEAYARGVVAGLKHYFASLAE